MSKPSDKMSVEELARKYQPILVLHSEEIYFPVLVEEYIRNTHWWTLTKPPRRIDREYEDMSSAQLDEELRVRPTWNVNTTLAIKNPQSNEIIYGCGHFSVVNDVPLVCHTHQQNELLFIQYVAFYAWNGYSRVAKLWTAGTHQADLEVVIAAVHADSQELLGFYLSQHGDMKFHTKEQLEWDPVVDRAKVYVARYNHAHYPHAARISRFAGFTEDVTDEGPQWFPQLFHVYDPDHELYDRHTMGFLRFKGDLGAGHVASFSMQSFWKGLPQEKHNNAPHSSLYSQVHSVRSMDDLMKMDIPAVSAPRVPLVENANAIVMDVVSQASDEVEPGTTESRVVLTDADEPGTDMVGDTL